MVDKAQFISVETIRRRLADVQRRAAEAEQAFRTLQSECTVLRSLLPDEASPAPVASNGHAAPSGGLLSPTDAVLDFVQRNPGTRRRDVVSRLADRIQSAATNTTARKQVLQSTVKHLAKTDRIILSGDIVWPVTLKEAKQSTT